MFLIKKQNNFTLKAFPKLYQYRVLGHWFLGVTKSEDLQFVEYTKFQLAPMEFHFEIFLSRKKIYALKILLCTNDCI